ncbi:MAG: hypothetical protein ACK4FS_11470, partial [Flavobacterium sp.]
MAVLLPSLIVSFINLGIGAASVYYIAQGNFRQEQILGNNVILAVVIGGFGLLIGLLMLFFRQFLFPGVPARYLIMGLFLILLTIFYNFIRYILLGTQRV